MIFFFVCLHFLTLFDPFVAQYKGSSMSTVVEANSVKPVVNDQSALYHSGQS